MTPPTLRRVGVGGVYWALDRNVLYLHLHFTPRTIKSVPLLFLSVTLSKGGPISVVFSRLHSVMN